MIEKYVIFCRFRSICRSWRGNGWQCALEADDSSVRGIFLESERGEGVSLVSGNLDILGDACQPFLALLRQWAADPSVCSEIGDLSPLVSYFYQQRQRENGEDPGERFVYYVCWQGKDEVYLLQWTTPWTSVKGVEEGFDQQWMRAYFQAYLPEICEKAAAQSE